MSNSTRSAGRARTGIAVGTVAGLLVGGTAWFLLREDSPVVVIERCTADVGEIRATLAPDQSANAGLVTGIAVQRGLPARAATIGIATAIQESGLRNIDYGDRDSLGLFQQRPSQGWGTPEEILDPLYATNAFYDVLVEIEGYESLEVTDASQRVQRSAFPDAYADHEAEGRAFASALAGHSPAALTCALRPAQALDGDALAERAASVADALEVQLIDAPVTVDDGTLVVDVTSSPEPERYAWAVGHWAVANAQARDIVRVQVGDRVWARTTPGAGWATSDEPADSTSVVVTLAS